MLFRNSGSIKDRKYIHIIEAGEARELLELCIFVRPIINVCHALHIPFLSFFLSSSIYIHKLIGQSESNCTVLSTVDMSGLFDEVDMLR